MSQPNGKDFLKRVEGRKLTADEWSAMIATESARQDANKRVNAYVCDLCKDFFVSIDRDPGVTPFMMPCGNPVHGRPPDPDPSLSTRKLKRLVRGSTERSPGPI
jgi:hypothetical protein